MKTREQKKSEFKKYFSSFLKKEEKKTIDYLLIFVKFGIATRHGSGLMVEEIEKIIEECLKEHEEIEVFKNETHTHSFYCGCGLKEEFNFVGNSKELYHYIKNNKHLNIYVIGNEKSYEIKCICKKNNICEKCLNEIE